MLDYHLKYFSYLYRFPFQKINKNKITSFHSLFLLSCSMTSSWPSVLLPSFSSCSCLALSFDALYKVFNQHYPPRVPYHLAFLSDMSLVFFPFYFFSEFIIHRAVWYRNPGCRGFFDSSNSMPLRS